MLRLFLSILALISVTCQAAAKSTIYEDFTESCVSAFNQSAGTEENTGKQICECTAEESKHQGVTAKELKAETAKIKKDPKYKIANKKLLAAFHVCTISAMQGAEHTE